MKDKKPATGRHGHAAYCDTCERFDEAMRLRDPRGVPFCSFCGASIPWPARVVMVPQHDSAFLFGIRQALLELSGRGA